MSRSLTVKAASRDGELQQWVVRADRRTEDKDTGVEAVGPTHVRGRRQLVTLE